MSDIEMDDLVFDLSDDEEEQQDADESDSELEWPGIQRITSTDDISILNNDELFLVYLQPLLSLAKTHIEPACKLDNCHSPVKMDIQTKGSAVYIIWVRACC